MWYLAGFLQFLDRGESLCRGEGTVKSKGKMERALLTGKAEAHICHRKGNLGPRAGDGQKILRLQRKSWRSLLLQALMTWCEKGRGEFIQ